MKKIFFLLYALLISFPIMAQKFLDVYQKGTIMKSIPASTIDSVGLSGSTMQDRKVNFYRDGQVINSYYVSNVDSIKVYRSENDPFVYLGIVGFNQELFEKPIDILASSTSNLYKQYVTNLGMKNGTLLYYAVDHALDLLTQKDFSTPLTSVNLITFTDGLDQGSLMMNGNYMTDNQYLYALSSRIKDTKVKGLPINAYSLGLRGSDITDYTLFKNNLIKLASSADKAFEVNSMNDVQTRLQEISNQIISISNRQTFSLKIPGHGNGMLICFTFDGKDPENSTMYIKGTFNLSDRSLTNVEYHGMKATTGSFVQGTQDGIFVTFTFTGMQREDGDGLIPTYSLREYYKTAWANTWQRNSEFSPSNNTQTTKTYSGTAIMLVLDCSSSMGTQFSNMKSYAQDFISQVASNAYNFKVAAPSNASATITENGDVRLSWDEVKYAESYDVYRSSSSSSSFKKIAEGVTSTTWVDENPILGDNYYCIITIGHGQTSSSSQTIFVPISSCPDNNHPHMIDLGLPSGTKWACCNVGTTRPEEYGGYYAWGETEEKGVYNEKTYKYYKEGKNIYIGEDISGTEYDVAYVQWGAPWSIPSYDQIKEIENNCSYAWTTENGIKGGKFTGPNGRVIFLPAGGGRWDDTLYFVGVRGLYWSSSSKVTTRQSGAYYQDITSREGWYWDDISRYIGRSVRPVVRN